MNKRAAIYARVSTDDQAERGYSLPSQIENCRLFGENLGYTITHVITEDYSGATLIAERPKGATLIELAKQREIDAVIVYQVDRLSRDIVNLLATIQAWLRTGIEIYSLDIGRIESELDIVLVIKGWQGSDERRKIVERTTRGKWTKAKSGKVVAARPPYGYRYVRDIHDRIDTLEPNENAKIVQMIYQWYVLGDETGKRLSGWQIAKKLSEIGIAPPGVDKRRKTALWAWYSNTVILILSNEAYAGVWRYGVRINATGTKRPSNEWITIPIPPIIERDLWEAAQAQKKVNHQFAKRNGKVDYLLSGRIRCTCGRAFTGTITGEPLYRQRRYACGANHALPHKDGKVCYIASVRADAIEIDVWDSIVQIFADLPRFEQLLRIAQADEQKALNPKQEEYETILKFIEDIEREAAEIGQALRRANGIVAKSLESDVEEINKRYEAFCNRRDILKGELGVAQLTDDAIQNAIQFAQDTSAGIQNADYETKRKNLELLQIKVTILGKRFVVNSLLGEWGGEIRKLPRKPKVQIVNSSV